MSLERTSFSMLIIAQKKITHGAIIFGVEDYDELSFHHVFSSR